jgi:hypothetical protein
MAAVFSSLRSIDYSYYLDPQPPVALLPIQISSESQNIKRTSGSSNTVLS